MTILAEEKVGKEKQVSFGTQDLLVLDLVHREKPVLGELKSRLPILAEQGIVEKIGRGRGVRHILSRRFYEFLGKQGVYTRRKGLDRESNKALLLKHIKDGQEAGSTLQVLLQVLPYQNRRQIQNLLQELKHEGFIAVDGRTRAAKWRLTAKEGPRPIALQIRR